MEVENETLNINQVAKMLDCSVTTVRLRKKNKSIPLPIKRVYDNSPLRWRKSDLLKYLRAEPAPINSRERNPALGGLDQYFADLVDRRVDQKLRDLNLIN